MKFQRPPKRLLSVLAALLVGACGGKGDPSAAARTFFEQLAGGRMQEAYESTAFALRTQQSQRTFEASVKEQGLAQFAGAQWEAPTFEGRTAKIRGSLPEANGGPDKLVVTLVEESGAWRVYSLRVPPTAGSSGSANLIGTLGRSTGFTEPIDRPMPTEKELQELTRETLLMFNDAVQAKSFERFYEDISKTWRRQVTVGQLNRAFEAFIEHGVDITGIKDLVPTFKEPPYITADGLLLIAGEFSTSPYRVVFTLRFVYELPKWELLGIEVNLQKQAERPAVPSD